MEKIKASSALMKPFLRIEHLSKSFGGVKAVNDLSLSLFPNRINAIIGPNGAGKTTLFNLITGFIKPDSGKIFFDDVELTHLPIHAISLMGIKRTLQIKSVFNSMTVYENLWITLSAQQGNLNPFKPIARYPDIQNRVEEVIEQLDLGRFQNTPAGALSYGDVALLEIGMAIITKPKMILFDEPVCGMSPAETRKWSPKLRRLLHKPILSLLNMTWMWSSKWLMKSQYLPLAPNWPLAHLRKLGAINKLKKFILGPMRLMHD